MREPFESNLTNSRGIAAYLGSGAPGLTGEKGIIDPRAFGVTLTKSF